VLPQTGLSGTASRLPVEIRRFPWIKRLAADYAFEYARLADFFAGNPAEPGAWREAIERAQRHPRERAAMVDVVQAQQRRRNAPPDAVAASARLRDPESIAIVTGQQAGLFGGPVFTLLKALTAIRLAERVSKEHGVPAVALFWVDAEDHDWDEVRSCGVLNTDLELAEVTIGAPPGSGEAPVARVRLDHSAGAAVEKLASLLPATDFTPSLLEGLRAAYRPGSGMVDAFAGWLESILGPRGLVVFDSADPAAKPFAAGLFARELEQAGTASRLAAAAGRQLVARGYHAQVAPQEDQAALFHLDGLRTPIRADQAGVWLDRARVQPAEFSPNVLLRPLVQDTLFPTAGYVAGPNELAYLAQLREVYAEFGVPMPLMVQRASATLVDFNVMRFLTRHNLSLESLRPQDEGALNQLLEAQIPQAITMSLDEAVRAVSERMETLSRSVAQLDTTLEGAARSASGRMQDDLKKLHMKIVQAMKRKDETVRRQFRNAQAQAFPGGHPQERALGFVYFLNKYGTGLVDRLVDDLPLDQGMHWVIAI
jgi:bacillithiol biosynthesis cysteine-adding enzyme BshC